MLPVLQNRDLRQFKTKRPCQETYTPFVCEDTNPTNWFCWSLDSSSNKFLERRWSEDLFIAFSIASLRIEEWWISWQYQNLANLSVEVQSTNSISSRLKKNTSLAWTSICRNGSALRCFVDICTLNSFSTFIMAPYFFRRFQLTVSSGLVICDLEKGRQNIIMILNIYFVGWLGGKSVFTNLSSKNKEETDGVVLQLVFHEATIDFYLDWGVMVGMTCKDIVVMISLRISSLVNQGLLEGHGAKTSLKQHCRDIGWWL